MKQFVFCTLFLAWIPFHLLYAQEQSLCKVLVEAGEISISPNQLCVLPNNGIYLLTGNELISLEENEASPIIRISEQIIPENILFTGTNVFAKNDTTIISCREKQTPLCVFDTNQFEMFPTTDDNLFVVTKNDSISMIFSCDAANGKVEPFIKIAEDVIYVAGDTSQCILVTSNSIYSIQEKRAWTLLNYFEPIVTATITSCGLVFSSANIILLLNGQNNVALIAERGCRRLLSNVDKLYIYYEDGTVLSYSMDLLKNE